MADQAPPAKVDRRVILAYLACFALAYLVPGLVVRRFLHANPDALTSRVAFFQAHAGEYDLVFVGDSRTYCDLSPEQLDARLGTHSVNVSTWANWFFSQYPALEDVLPHVRKDAVVVWSIGHQNFDLLHDPMNYPIGARNVPRYLGWGYGVPKVAEHFIGMLPGLDVYANRDAIRAKIDGALAAPLYSNAPGPVGPPRNAEAAAALRARYAADPHVISIETLQDGDVVTSIGVRRDRGHYERIELDHAYFRGKQRELLADLKPLPGRYQADPARWNNFVAILDLFERHGVRLIVNEVEEAPYNYSVGDDKRLLREFMRTRVRAEVERRGIPYLRADWDQLTDADYFDWNHLNSDGVAKYTALLAPLLQDALKR